MRTTVRLRDGLLKQARKYAAEHDTTLTSMLDQGLRLVLREEPPAYKTREKKFRLTTFKGTGLRSGIDPTSNAAMLDIADGLNVPG
jgi:hypothetical protein